ncbi:transposase [Aquabacterium sp. A7-Y]|uniref:IS66-like element accessory protein TnpA n=1 Tax=Aquabacterium sp. A7-Y TaxID=1349605 RepID=UPI00223E5B72|nr:transposase [Aquabacterium sp. A7-Y]MCW7540957.1 transposase [Aquabacterium sp. A7-Y]
MQSKPTTRRRHNRELKAVVLAACEEPGASVAAVAQAHGLNANLVHKWRRQRAGATVTTPQQDATPAAPEFIALQIPTPETRPAPVPDIRIELRRGAVSMAIVWPGAAAGDCAMWLREWLK